MFCLEGKNTIFIFILRTLSLSGVLNLDRFESPLTTAGSCLSVYLACQTVSFLRTGILWEFCTLFLAHSTVPRTYNDWIAVCWLKCYLLLCLLKFSEWRFINTSWEFAAVSFSSETRSIEKNKNSEKIFFRKHAELYWMSFSIWR